MSQELTKCIAIRGARTHNLRNISLDIPRDRFVVVTGLSGSGKSSLAFDTIYAEGQRRYVESLSAYARQFLGQMIKPDVDHIDGLPPTLAIAQQAGRGSPRSTVATTTEIHDYLRLLFARVGTPHCPKCGRVIHRQTVPHIVDEVLALPEGTRVMVLAPLVRGRPGDHQAVLDRVVREGFVRLRIDGALLETKDAPRLDATQPHTIEAVVDRLVMKPDLRTRVGESVEAALRVGEGLVIVAREERSAASDQQSAGGGSAGWADAIYSENYACIACGLSVPELHPRMFSFNSPHGACPTCDGLGNVLEFDERRVVPDAAKSLEDGAIEPWRRAGPKLAEVYGNLIREFCKRFKVLPSAPLKKMPARTRRILLHGTGPEDETELRWRFEGVLPNLRRRWQTTESESARERLHEYMTASPCPACAGARLRPESLAVRIAELNIDDVARLSVDAAAGFFSGLALTGEQARIAAPIVEEIRRRLSFMIDVGIGYLTLARESRTLSGGEAQRIRLATQIGSGLVGVCYVLDEPTTGLHPRDTARLLRTLRRLVDMGNSLLVVEHDADVIRQADWIVDVGPGAGAHGGRVLANGPLETLRASAESLTARYIMPLPGGQCGPATAVPPPSSLLTQQWHPDIVPLLCEQRDEGSGAGSSSSLLTQQWHSVGGRGPEARPHRKVTGKAIEIKDAAENNLKKIDVRIPLGVFCCVTGVSGSGKSTLVNQILLPALRSNLLGSAEKAGAHEKISGGQHIEKIIEIDQAPIGRSPRSGPATYTGVFDQVRELMAKTREAKMRGYTAARFSFNVKGGRCEACRGQGVKRIEMHFLADLFVECDQCKGTRYSREMLDIRYRGRTIADILALRVDEALEFFDAIPVVRQMLAAMADVGLGYMALGQPASTLSGGEAQRVKLAAELGRSAAGHTLYVLDEPTSGLHFADIDRLLAVLNRLCDAGHSIVVIEHNLEVIRQADWIIDLGPEGGDAGGRIVAEGRPEEVAGNPRSHTGQWLRR